MTATRSPSHLPRGATLLVIRSAIQVAIAVLLILGILPTLVAAAGS